MKIRGILLGALAAFGFSGAFAQVEYDDMYFNAEDRASLKAQKGVELAYHTPETSRFGEDESVNPTDSYSARNINPEYTARAESQSAQAQEDDYFVNNYQYNANRLDNWNNNYNSWYNSSWYRSNYYSPFINSWNTPYYGYNTFNSPWYDPFWSYNGWSSSFSFHFGRPWNYGWGGYYNYWNRPYYGWDPYFGVASGWYGGGYWNNYMYPGTVIIVNGSEGNGRGVVYGKRPTRSTTAVTRTPSRSRTADFSRRDDNAGRYNSATNGRQADYYHRSRSSSSSTFHNSGTTQYNRSRPSWNSGDRYNSGGRSYTPSTPSRSYSTPSTSSPSRSMGSGSSGRSRGRY